MYTTHLTGCWKRGQVLLRWAESTFRSTPSVDAAIEAEWQNVKARLGDRIFDGPMCRMEAYESDHTGTLVISLSSTIYRIFVGTNMAHPEWADTLGRQVMANTVGVSTTLVTAEGFVMLGRRSDHVAYYPRMLHPFSGSLEPRVSQVPGAGERDTTAPDLFDEAQRELNEELGLAPADITEIACIGVIEDTRLRHPEAILYARTAKTREQIEMSLQGNEHTAAWHCRASRSAIEAALIDRTEFTPVAQGSLELLGNHLGG